MLIVLSKRHFMSFVQQSFDKQNRWGHPEGAAKSSAQNPWRQCALEVSQGFLFQKAYFISPEKAFQRRVCALAYLKEIYSLLMTEVTGGKWDNKLYTKKPSEVLDLGLLQTDWLWFHESVFGFCLFVVFFFKYGNKQLVKRNIFKSN